MRERLLKTIGTSDFKRLIDKGGYFVDKSLFIKMVWEDAEVLLLPRPRRFGKTLNLSMLRYFFEKTEDDRSYLFEGLKIWESEEYRKLQGKFPVIYLTFKDVNYPNWEQAYESIKELISDLYARYKYILELEELEEREKEKFLRIIKGEGTIPEYKLSLKRLSEYLERYHKEKVIVLIDEYDAPIQEAYIRGYYDEMVNFMRGMLGAVLKDNVSLQKGVITGCLRVAKESIFSGLNNLKVYTLLSKRYSDFFGFKEEEVIEILKFCNLETKIEKIRDWYNGYNFGGQIVYNPWSILNYISSQEDGFLLYWVNTSSNELIRKLIFDYGYGLKGEMERLLKDDWIEKSISENIVFKDLEYNEEYVWSLMLFSGYLKSEECYQKEGDERLYCKLSIPNREVKYIFREFFLNWVQRGLGTSEDVRELIKAILEGNDENFEELLTKLMINSLSYYDVRKPEPEKVYHAFVVGLLVNIGNRYIVKSNPESGYGRVDVLIIPRKKGEVGVVMELKVRSQREKSVEESIERGKRQIEEKRYEQELINKGANPIIKYVVVFDGKRVWVRKV